MSRFAIRSSTAATALLIFVTFIWGFTFVTNQYVLKYMTVADLMAWRFTIAALVMLLARPKAIMSLTRNQLAHGTVLGLLLGLGYLAQMVGLKGTTATASGFITGMFVVITPLISGFVLKQPISRYAWISVGLATVGLGLIALKGTEVSTGDSITLICAFLFACHIVGLSRWSQTNIVYGLTTLQLCVVAVFSLTLSLIKGGPTVPPNNTAWLCIVLLALFASCLGFFAQTWVQSKVSSTRAAIILTMEPVFAGIAGVSIGTDQLTKRLVAGALCILVAMYLVELSPHKPDGVLHLEI
ncbi:MAG: DMT family transporter [Actinobacteria bacterium]|nr:DMT family transporter [Actinomycetota bacterium]